MIVYFLHLITLPTPAASGPRKLRGFEIICTNIEKDGKDKDN
jgi:hypothetical protein